MPPRPRDIPHGDNEEEEEDRYSHSNNVKSNVKSNNNHDDTTSLSKPLLHKQHHHHHHHYDNHRDPFSTNTSHFTQCSSWLAHFLNLTKQIVGAGALGLPGALATIQQQAGNTATIYALLPLALLIIAIGSVSAYGFCLIGRLCAVTQAMSYRQAWARTVDPRNSWMPAWACVLVAVSSVTTYNMVLAETLPALTRPFFELPRSTALLTVTTFCLLPLCLLKELSSLAPYSGIGLAAMFYTAVVMTQRYWYGHYQEGEHQPLWEALSDEQRPMFGGNDDDVNAMNDWKTVLSTFLTHPQSYVTIISMLSTSFMAHYNAPKYYWELPPAPNNSNSNNSNSSNDDDGDDTKPKELFTQDALELSRDLPIDDTEEEDEPEVTKENISTMATTVTSTTPVTAPTPATSEPADEPMNVDPAEKVYDVAKGIWGWGKGVIIFSPFLGIAEGIAGKVVETAGSSLEDVDNALTGKLHQLDDGILNPAVKMVVTTVMGAAGKTEAFIKPIILTILKPIDFMIKSKPEESDDTPAPEVTPDVAMN
mmetsp:Transcript_19248/g.45385  ORF Transcript_19248/g.45385 Transcript_19248/m.45385 type:complete len:536 (-) Transcript_19248:57-1664(-)